MPQSSGSSHGSRGSRGNVVRDPLRPPRPVSEYPMGYADFLHRFHSHSHLARNWKLKKHKQWSKLAAQASEWPDFEAAWIGTSRGIRMRNRTCRNPAKEGPHDAPFSSHFILIFLPTETRSGVRRALIAPMMLPSAFCSRHP